MIFVTWLIALIVTGFLGILVLECGLALLQSPRIPLGRRGTTAVLIPAHNEELGISQTLIMLRPQLIASDRVVVVADNCTDKTARLAWDEGSEVVERFNSTQRGKGFALEAGVRYLSTNPPDVVVVLDADCELDTGSIDALARAVTTSGRPCQARNLLRLPKNAGPEASVSTFAFLVKNWVRPRALQRIGLPVLLNGTGMAFPWNIIEGAPLATGEIVEDLSLGLHFTRQRLGPVFCETAHVWSDLPNDPKAAVEQRTRWEHGYLGSILRDVPKLLLDAFRQRRIGLLCVAIDLMVPPLALLAMLSCLSFAIILFLSLRTNHWTPLCMLAATGITAGLGIVAVWFRFARDLIPAKVILAIPGYVVRKLNIYKRFVTARQKEWVRTERSNQG